MFNRQYILAVLRNLLIFSLISPILIFYIITLVYRIPNIDREKMLRYISETADLSYLSTPAAEYRYFFALLDNDGNAVWVSDEADMEYGDNSQNYLDSVQRKYYVGKSHTAFNVLPDDDAFNHRAFGDYFFSSLLVPGGGGEYDLLHVIFREEDLTLWSIAQTAIRANLICLLIASPLCIVFAYFEIRPTKRAWVNQKRFIAQTSHELRTPIAVITAAMDHFGDVEDLASMEETGAMIRQELGVMTNIVNDLMFLSRVDAKQIRPKKSNFELSSVLLESYIAAQVLAVEKQIRFEAFDSDQVVLCADEMMIRQMVTILLKNAVDYTRPGGAVGLCAKVSGSRVEIAVTDTGIGISSRERRYIFRRFYRADPDHSPNQGNSGMGLAIASWIVKQHRGKIRVESEQGAGSRFVVTLPTAKV